MIFKGENVLIDVIKIILQIISIVFGYMISLDKSKKNIILYTCILNFIGILMFFVTDRYDGVFSTVIITIRCILFLYRDKYKTDIVFYFCLVAHIIVGFFIYIDIFSLVLILTPIATCIAFWYGNVLQVKYNAVIVNTLCILYYIHIGLYFSSINIAINVILTIYSIYKLKCENY